MQILMQTGGVAQTNAFVIADEVAKAAVLFDAPDHTVAPLLDQVQQNGWDLIGLWLTHGHFDHVADHQVVRDAFADATQYIHKLDEAKLLKPNSRLMPLPFSIPPGRADGFVEDGQELEIGSLKCRVIFTPGHSPGHVMYYFEKEKTLVGGDLIIGGAIGRYDLPDANYDDLVKSVQRVMKLPLDTKLLPGHGDPSTLAEELATNPFVKQMAESM